MFFLGCTNDLADLRLLRQILSSNSAPRAKVLKLPKSACLNPPDHRGSCLVLRGSQKGKAAREIIPLSVRLLHNNYLFKFYSVG